MHDIKKIINEIIKYLEKNIKTTEEKFVVNSIKKCVLDKKNTQQRYSKFTSKT